MGAASEIAGYTVLHLPAIGGFSREIFTVPNRVQTHVGETGVLKETMEGFGGGFHVYQLRFGDPAAYPVICFFPGGRSGFAVSFINERILDGTGCEGCERRGENQGHSECGQAIHDIGFNVYG